MVPYQLREKELRGRREKDLKERFFLGRQEFCEQKVLGQGISRVVNKRGEERQKDCFSEVKSNGPFFFGPVQWARIKEDSWRGVK